MRALTWAMVLMLALGLAACGGSKTNSGDTTNAGDTTDTGVNANFTSVQLSGVASKGPIRGADITVYPLGDDGSVCEALGTTMTEPDGSFSISVQSQAANFLIEVKNGIYRDEATGVDTDNSSTFRAAVVEAANTPSVSVTPLTEIAVRHAESQGGLTTSYVQSANALVSSMIGGIDIISTAPADVSNSSSASAASGQKDYGLALAAISQMIKDGAATDIDSAVTGISADIADNNLDATGAGFMNAVSVFLISNNNRSGATPENSQLDNSVSNMAGGLPVATGLTATPVSPSRIDLSWMPPKTPQGQEIPVAGYKVYRDDTLITHAAASPYDDTGLQASKTYCYRVAAFDAAGLPSNLSEAVCAATLADTVAPTTPTGLIANAVSASRIELNWNASTDNVGVTGYSIWRDGVFLTPATATSALDTGLNASTQYCYEVSAYDAAGNDSALSIEACATPCTLILTFPDANFEACVRQTINKPTGGILLCDVQGVTQLDCQSRSISSIEGIQYFTGMGRLSLGVNNITDLTPLANLNLGGLYLQYNNISDITPLGNMTNMQELELSVNNTSDISPLRSLTNLQRLYLYDNNISDITPLSNLTDLQLLDLGRNSVSDISSLSNLPNLWIYLGLGRNNISDITSLANMTDLTQLNISSNNISDITPLGNMTLLETLYLNTNDINDVTPLSSLNGLQTLNLCWNYIADCSPVSFVPDLQCSDCQN